MADGPSGRLEVRGTEADDVGGSPMRLIIQEVVPLSKIDTVIPKKNHIQQNMYSYGLSRVVTTTEGTGHIETAPGEF